MRKRAPVSRTAFVVGSLILLILTSKSSTTAQDQTQQPRTVHNACAGNCVADVIFLHSGMGDTSARNAYHGWFNSYYDLTGCDDPAWRTDIEFLLEIIGDAVGAPGAPTMQCWQGLAAQASLCSDTCSSYFIEDARYAPNVKVTLDQGGPGYLEVTLDNQSNLGKLPELQPNAYSRQFPLKTYLTYEDGEPLLVNETPMPSLSFPNWITRGGLDNCIDHYGFDSDRCQLISWLATPSIVSTPVEFLDGVLYDLTSQVSDLGDASGSFSQDGYIRLLSDGDSITIQQGPFAGYKLIKSHYLSSGTHTVHLEPWDASAGAVTITNHECNSWLSTCWVTGVRHETDTYVYALQGPPDKVLAGTYTVEVVADIPHEKDFADNRVSYSYDSSALENQQGGGPEAGGEETGALSIRVEDLPIIDLPGPGTYAAIFDANTLGVLYRLTVPDEVSFMFVRLVSRDGGQYSAFVRRGSIPVPDFPVIGDEYHCWAQSDVSYSGGCPFSNPYQDDYYIFVHRWDGGGHFQLEIEWTIPATPTPIPTAIPTETPTATAEPESGTEGGDLQGATMTEVEPNDGYVEANGWDMRGPFTGQLSDWSDVDVLLLDFTEPGIYTFALTDVGPLLRIKMTLVRASTHNVLNSGRATVKGAPAYLTFDASTGEQYYLIISGIAMSSATDQGYTLTLYDFIPDPDEPNDSRDAATPWDLTAGPVSGYFWDKTTGRHDYFTFLAPQTLDGGPLTFNLSNPSPELRVRLTLLRDNGQLIASTSLSAPGQGVTLSEVLEAGRRYYLKLETLFDRTSLEPYTLSAAYTPAAGDQSATPGGGRPVSLHGEVYQQGTIGPQPLEGIAIYVQVTGQAPVLLAVTDAQGAYRGTLTVAEGQQVRTWAQAAGLTFQPEEDVWSPDPRQRSRHVVFVVAGPPLVQQTPTAESQASPTASPPPPTAVFRATRTPLPPQPTATPEPAQPVTVITGAVWRLFPASEPAGVAAASVILAINGLEQPAALSMIDGTYQIEVAGLQPGDQLSLRAAGPEDTFEPLAYQWLAEAGVTHWRYDFYSYWGTITPPERDDQNRIYGYVRDAQGTGIPGVTLLLQMGTSDALQVLGPTDATGYYETFVRLPNRIMVTVWPQTPGYLPSRLQFFHAYAPENREVSFMGMP